MHACDLQNTFAATCQIAHTLGNKSVAKADPVARAGSQDPLVLLICAISGCITLQAPVSLPITAGVHEKPLAQNLQLSLTQAFDTATDVVII